MGGMLEVQSQPGVGSTFTTKLTLKVVDRTPSAGLTVKPNISKVLIVDDNVTNCAYMEGVFKFLDIPCKVCYNGEEALKIIREATQTDQLFDFIIVDHRMPGMDGVTLIKKIKRLLKDTSIPVILMLSLLEKSMYQESAKSLGIHKFLSKPIKVRDLSAVLASASDSRESAKTVHEAERKAKGTATRIAVAEDNAVNMSLITKILTKMGFEVLKATNGIEAVEVVNTGNPALIFMDIHMPLMNGYEATETIRKLPEPLNNVTIIALTADAKTEDRKKCLATGMNDFIAKPFRLAEIKTLMKNYFPDHFSEGTSREETGKLRMFRS